MIILMTSKRFSGVPTIRPPPLPLVTNYLAILHCSSRFNLWQKKHCVTITIIIIISPSPSPSPLSPTWNKYASAWLAAGWGARVPLISIMGDVQRGGWVPTIRPSNLEHNNCHHFDHSPLFIIIFQTWSVSLGLRTWHMIVVIILISPPFIIILIIFSIITIIIMGEVQIGGLEFQSSSFSLFLHIIKS